MEAGTTILLLSSCGSVVKKPAVTIAVMSYAKPYVYR